MSLSPNTPTYIHMYNAEYKYIDAKVKLKRKNTYFQSTNFKCILNGGSLLLFSTGKKIYMPHVYHSILSRDLTALWVH